MNYVIVVAFRQGDQKSVILVDKNKPSWMSGKLNLPGGKVEKDETAEQAAYRELKEETGYETTDMSLMGCIQDEDSTIFCFRAIIHKDAGEISPRPEETETVAWYLWENIYTNKKLIPNLRVIVPLVLTNCWDWTITDNYRSSLNDYHQIKIDVMSP